MKNDEGALIMSTMNVDTTDPNNPDSEAIISTFLPFFLCFITLTWSALSHYYLHHQFILTLSCLCTFLLSRVLIVCTDAHQSTWRVYRWQTNGTKALKRDDGSQIWRIHYRCSNWNKPDTPNGCKARFSEDFLTKDKRNSLGRIP